MDERKARRYNNNGEGEAQYYDADEVEQIRQETKSQVEEQYQRQVAKQLNDIDGVTQSDIGDIFDISQSRVSQIVNSGD